MSDHVQVMTELAKLESPDAATLIRLHETALFVRAYPPNQEVLRLAGDILMSFADRVARLGSDLGAFEEPDVSGIAGTSFSAIFSYPIARHLAEHHGACVRIDWERYEKPERMGPLMPPFLPLLEEDWPVEANVPYQEWFQAAQSRARPELAWLLGRFRDQPRLYDFLEVPVLWKLGNSSVNRSKMRVPGSKIFYHGAPLLGRRDVNLTAELASPPLPVTRLSLQQGRKMLDLARDTSAMRYRELYGFSYGDPTRALKADAGRGLQIYLFGLPPEARLPLRTYHAAIFIKNGVPVGYVETLSLCDRIEAGFNIYYTFREGESAWLYARTLHLFRQLLGVNSFSVDPYQIGFHNSEGIDSGAFWFYRKLGFRPVEPQLARLVQREEKKIAAAAGYRTPARTLRRLSEGYLIFDGPGANPGGWDGFRVRNLGLAVQRKMAAQFASDSARMSRTTSAAVNRALGSNLKGRAFESLALVLILITGLSRWSRAEKRALVQIIRAKSAPDETGYLRLMQQHPRLCEALQELGNIKPGQPET